jgi:hypothetical protein
LELEVTIDNKLDRYRTRTTKESSGKKVEGSEESQIKLVEHIVCHRHFYPTQFGSFSNHSCTDSRVIRVPMKTDYIISTIITDDGGIPEWGSPWKKFQKSIVLYNTDEPRLISRVNRLRRRIEKGDCLTGGPLFFGTDGRPRIASRRIRGSIKQKDMQFFLDMLSAFSSTPAMKLIDREKSSQPKKSLLWKRFGKDPAVIAVPMKKEWESPFWKGYLRIFRGSSERDRKKRSEALAVRLQAERGPNKRTPRFPSLQLTAKDWTRRKNLMIKVFMRSAPIPRTRKKRPAFQSPRTLSEVLSAEVLKCHRKSIRLLFPPFDQKK